MPDKLLHYLGLQPAFIVAWPWQPWQVVTYCFIHLGILDILFSMLMVWMFGSMLEGSYGARFMREVYFTSAIGGRRAGHGLFLHPRTRPDRPEAFATGARTGIFGILVALAKRMGDLEIFLWFLVNIRIKYLVAIYVLIDLAGNAEVRQHLRRAARTSRADSPQLPLRQLCPRPRPGLRLQRAVLRPAERLVP